MTDPLDILRAEREAWCSNDPFVKVLDLAIAEIERLRDGLAELRTLGEQWAPKIGSSIFFEVAHHALNYRPAIPKGAPEQDPMDRLVEACENPAPPTPYLLAAFAEYQKMKRDREWVLVPREPTEEMIEAHQGVCAGDADEAGPARIREAYQAMLAAVPGRPTDV